MAFSRRHERTKPGLVTGVPPSDAMTTVLMFAGRGLIMGAFRAKRAGPRIILRGHTRAQHALGGRMRAEKDGCDRGWNQLRTAVT
jgi:hypothetical protein